MRIESIRSPMKKAKGSWVVYKKRGVEYIHASKRFKTKREAEKERERLQQNSGCRRKTLGVGFVRSA